MSRRPIPPARALAMLAVLALLAGCSTLSPYSRLTKLDLALSAGERVNPDSWPAVAGGSAAVRAETPGGVRERRLLQPLRTSQGDPGPRPGDQRGAGARPGERVELKLSVEEGAAAGVLAAYRDLGEASWRYVVPVTAKELTRVELKLGQKGIQNAGELLGKAGDAR